MFFTNGENRIFLTVSVHGPRTEWLDGTDDVAGDLNVLVATRPVVRTSGGRLNAVMPVCQSRHAATTALLPLWFRHDIPLVVCPPHCTSPASSTTAKGPILISSDLSPMPDRRLP